MRELGSRLGLQRHPAAAGEHRALALHTSIAIIDVSSVANAGFALCAEPPERVLDEPREIRRESAIELPRIDRPRELVQNAFAPIRAITSRTECVPESVPEMDPGAMQKVMDKRVDGDHRPAGLSPTRPTGIDRHQKIGE